MQAVQEQVAELMDEQSVRRKLQEEKETFSHDLYQSDLPPNEETRTPLSREGIEVVWAVTEITGIAMLVSIFYPLDKLIKLSKLTNGLVDALLDLDVIPGW